MGLLDTDIRQIVGSAADFLMLDVTYTVVSSTHVVGTGITETETDYACRGFVEEDSQKYIDQGLIGEGDRVVTILQTSLAVTPSKNDKVTIRSKASTVRDVGQDPARATWVLGVSP